MKRNHSGSYALRLRLLFAMASSLLAVLVICAVLFDLTYQQSTKTVLTHSEQLAYTTSYNLSQSYYQALYAHLSDLVNGFCMQTTTEMNAYEMQFSSREDLAGYVTMRSGEYYYNMIFGFEGVFFVYDGSELKSYCFQKMPAEDGSHPVISADDTMEKAFTSLTEHMNRSEEAAYYEDYPDFMSYLQKIT